MSSQEKHLYARYFYNCIIEFLYFIILYIETYGNVSLYNLYKYAKLFNAEVSTFILIFEGKTAEDKLKQMLQTLDCFELSDDKIKNIKNTNLKQIIYEDFILSKCVDLLLKGLSNVDDICKNLNLNPTIKINKQNFLDVIEKYNFIHINSNQKVSLNHVHGLLGFQDHLYNSVTSYFHNILYHDKLLSFNEIRNHYNSLLFCGLNNILGVFSILYCSSEFDCQNGFLLLKKKSKKHTNKKPLYMEVLEAKFLSRSLPIGQVVYSSQGPTLQGWTGEIGTLGKNWGVIYCVVNFTNGYQGVFNIYFNQATLRVISEINNLLNYISVRDVVEFDAKYYTGKKLDRCWRATRVKLVSSNKLQYDELLSDKLNLDSELERNRCSNSMCCSDVVIPINCKLRDFSTIKQSKYLEENQKSTESKYHEGELRIEDLKASDSSTVQQSKYLEEDLNSAESKCNEGELKIEDHKARDSTPVQQLEEDLKSAELKCNEGELRIEDLKASDSFTVQQSKYLEEDLKSAESKCNEGEFKIEYHKVRDSSIVQQLKYLEEDLKSTDSKCHEEELKIKDHELLFKVRNFSMDNQLKYVVEDLKNTELKCHNGGLKIEDHTILSNNLDTKVEPDHSNSEKHILLKKEKSIPSFESFTNSVIPDYYFMFAHIHMLMADKGVAVTKYEDQFYNILFMKSSLYPPTKSERFFSKRQKVLVLIPYLNKIENFCVATLVYGLDEDDMKKINTSDIPAKEFAFDKIFPLFIRKGIIPAFCEHYSFQNGPKINHTKHKIKLTELNDAISTQYNISLANDNFQMLLHNLCKANLNGTKIYNQFCNFAVALSRCFPKYSRQKKNKPKNRRKLNRMDSDYKNNSQHINLKDLYLEDFKKSPKKGRLSNSNLTVKSKSLDAIHTSNNSLNSYETCSDSTESFYSCKSRCNTPECSNINLTNSCSSAVSEISQKSSPKKDSLLKIGHNTSLPTILNSECSILITNVDQDLKRKVQNGKSLSTRKEKYLSLQSVSSFKPSCKKKKILFSPFMLKQFCKNCIKNTITVTGSVCMVSVSFFFFTVKIHSFDIVLPLPKKDVPKSFVEKIKLNSTCEITINLYVPAHLSHIIRVKVL